MHYSGIIPLSAVGPLPPSYPSLSPPITLHQLNDPQILPYIPMPQPSPCPPMTLAQYYIQMWYNSWGAFGSWAIPEKQGCSCWEGFGGRWNAYWCAAQIWGSGGGMEKMSTDQLILCGGLWLTEPLHVYYRVFLTPYPSDDPYIWCASRLSFFRIILFNHG